MTYQQRQARAYRLYVQYKTHTAEYKALAASFGLNGSGELNREMCVIYNARLRARNLRRLQNAT